MIAGQEFFFNAPLNKASNKPSYVQLYDHLKGLIAGHYIRLGDAFPSEQEFCKQYCLSRTTVRQAFAELEKDNLITRIKGKGTFVSEPKLNRTLNNLYSFSDEMSDMGLTASACIRSFDLIEAPISVAHAFGFDSSADKRVFKIVRIRTVDDSPLTLETVYIPYSICPVLSKELLNSTSLYHILHQFANIVPVRACELYSAVPMPKKICKLLECSSNASAFLVDRTSYDINNRIFEIAHIYVRGDRCRYEVELKANNVSFVRQVDKN